MDPLVSIIIPVYNTEAYVVEAVNSALGQTYQKIEVIVVDDGSSDKSLSLIKQINDSRLRVFAQINQGACVARNRGVIEAKGEFIKFLDSDDVLYPEAVAVQLEQQAELGEDEEVFGDFDFIDEQAKVFYQNIFDEKAYLSSNQDFWLLKNWEMLISCPLHRRGYLIANKGFDNKLRSGQESFLHFMLSIKGVKFVYKPCRVFGYRSHQGEGRISSQRMRSLPKLYDLVYRNDALLGHVQDKYGMKANEYTTEFSQRYFDAAWTYFCYSMAAEGRYCLQRSFAIPHLNYPKLKKKTSIARCFMFVGRLVGFVNAARLFNWLIRFLGLGKNESKNSKLQKVMN